jgi:hypothetical protein
MTRRLPVWIAGGPEVSTLAYQIVCVAFGDPPRPPDGYAFRTRDEAARLDIDGIGAGAVVAHLCDVLDADEGDICRALAELKRVGVFVTDNPKARQA